MRYIIFEINYMIHTFAGVGQMGGCLFNKTIILNWIIENVGMTLVAILI